MTRELQRLAAFIGPMAPAVPDPGRRGEYVSDAGHYRVPIQYEGVRTWIGAFPAALDGLQPLLPPGLQAQRLRGDRGLLVVQFVDMPNTTIGPYREVGIGIPVRRKAAWPDAPADAVWSPPPMFTIWLPVTSRLARDSGRAIWGYPKTIADVEFHASAERFRGRLLLDSRLLLEVDAPCDAHEEHGTIQMRSVTVLGSQLAHTTITAPAKVARAEDCAASLQIHPGSVVTDLLCEIDVAPEPVDATFVRDFAYELAAPRLVNLGRA